MDQEARYWRDKWKEAIRVAQTMRDQVAALTNDLNKVLSDLADLQTIKTLNGKGRK